MSRVTLATNKQMTFPAVAVCKVNQIDCNQTFHYLISSCYSRDSCPLSKLCQLYHLARCDIVMTYMDDAAFGAFHYQGVGSKCGEQGPWVESPQPQTQALVILSGMADQDRMAIAQDKTTLINRCYLMGTAHHPACASFKKGLQVRNCHETHAASHEHNDPNTSITHF